MSKPRLRGTCAVLSLAVLSLALAACGDGAPDGEDAAGAGNTPSAAVENTGPEKAGTDAAPYRFGTETAAIVYAHQGSLSGTSTLYIEQWGERAAIVENLLGSGGARNQTALWIEDRMFVHDHAREESWATGIRYRALEPSMFAAATDKQLELAGYERIGAMEIAGQTCEHWRNPTMKLEACRWNGFDLLLVTGQQEDGRFTTKKIAVDIVTDTAIPEDILALPYANQHTADR